MLKLACIVWILGMVQAGPSFRRTDIFQPNFHETQRYRDTRSTKGEGGPAVEVLMHLPAPFKDVSEFKSFLGIKPDRSRRQASKRLVDVRSYEISQLAPFERTKRHNHQERTRQKREAGIAMPESETITKSLKVENEQDPDGGKFSSGLNPETIVELPELIRGPVYTAYPGGALELTSDFDYDDLRKRRASASADDDEMNQREKRMFMENGGENRESTTTPRYWKRKMESPPFITGGKEGRADKAQSSYTPPQHRSADSARESHSMKDLDKTVQSNEIPRSSQDNLYSSSNRRAYNSRQAENFTPPPPKSFYDTLEANGGRKSRTGYGRNTDGGRDQERSRQTYDPSYTDPYSSRYTYQRPYDRYIYPYPGEVAGRGVEYYHRSYDPVTGRIIYYANMPDNGRSYYDSRWVDPTSRSYYANGRTYYYDAYGRTYVQPYDHRPVDAYGQPLDYLKARNGQDSYTQYQGGEKTPRDARYDGYYDKERYLREDLRNKTYVIYDAEERRPSYPRSPPLPGDINRYGYPAPPPTPSGLPYQPTPSYQPTTNYQPYPSSHTYKERYYPTTAPWGLSTRPVVGYNVPGYSDRRYTIPDMPLHSPSRSNLEKIKKT